MPLKDHVAARWRALRGVSSGRPERPLRLLIAASLLLPVAMFGIAALLSYRAHMAAAQDHIQRNLVTIYEHALKVFDTFDVTAIYLDELLHRVTDDQIRADEGYYHARLKRLADSLPQLEDIWIIGAEGRPLAAGTVFPMPRDLDVSDRSYFRVHRDDPALDVHVSEVMQARTANTRGQPVFFALSRKRRDGDGRFAGVTTISIAPRYFVDYYRTLPPPAIAALIRGDGLLLARFPEREAAFTRLSLESQFLSAIRNNPEAGVLAGSADDGIERIVAYRKLPHRDLYVAAGMDRAQVLRGWLAEMSGHLVFGVPATLALIALGMMALRRTQREAAAYEQLRLETARREETETALRQAQRMEAIGRLTGGIAHDFNNLLTAILGNIDLAARRMSDADERVRASLNAAREASTRAATLVQRLLSFSRQHPLEVKAVDVNRLVQEMSELLRRTIGETVAIETVQAGGLWKAAVDPNQLENALLNLAVNARDAMPEGGRLTIETANVYLDDAYAAAAGSDVAPGQYVMVAVSDTGCGMDPQTIERAFDPFFTTKPPGIGTGLGLSMVYGFVKQSGGHVRIYSEVGEGTTVKLYFPRLPPSSKVPEWPAEPPREAPVEPGARQHATVLLVEDDEQVNRFAVEALQERGYRVIAASDGTTALQLLEATPAIDILFTDVVLPGGMNGRQLADEVRRRRPHVKVLFATGYTRNAIIHQGRLDPGVDLLSKPFTPDALARKLADLLAGSRVAAASEGDAGSR